MALEQTDGEALVGDLIFAQGIGRTDFPRSDPAAMMTSLERLFAEVPRETRIHPGHGPWGVSLGAGGALREDVHVSALTPRRARWRPCARCRTRSCTAASSTSGWWATSTCDGGRVRVAIRLTVAGCPLKAEIQRRVTDALSGLEGVEGVQVTMDAMTDDERRAPARGPRPRGAGRPSPFQEGSRTTVIGIASGKGGVGKSSITANLAAGPGAPAAPPSACSTPTSTATRSPA